MVRGTPTVARVGVEPDEDKSMTRPVDYRRRTDDTIEGKMGKSSNGTTCTSNGGRHHDLREKRSKFHVWVEVRNNLNQYVRSNRRRRHSGKLCNRIDFAIA